MCGIGPDRARNAWVNAATSMVVAASCSGGPQTWSKNPVRPVSDSSHPNTLGMLSKPWLQRSIISAFARIFQRWPENTLENDVEFLAFFHHVRLHQKDPSEPTFPQWGRHSALFPAASSRNSGILYTLDARTAFA